MIETHIATQLTLEASRRVVELGLWPEFETILERVGEVVPEAQAISVWLDQPPAEKVEPVVLIMAEVPSESDEGRVDQTDPRELQLERWARSVFPEQVWRQFLTVVIRDQAA